MNLSSLLANKKIIFALVGVVILVELIWAGLSLRGNNPSGVAAVQPRQSTTEGTLSLSASKNSLRVGETITVSIDVASAAATDGLDVILQYDPKLLSVVTSGGKKPVALGTLYDDYPLNQVDEGTGRIAVSGITSKPQGVVARGNVGTVKFTAKAPGKAIIAFDFTPGSTTDSNVIETKTTRDVLGSVTDLELNITP